MNKKAIGLLLALALISTAFCGCPGDDCGEYHKKEDECGDKEECRIDRKGEKTVINVYDDDDYCRD